MPDRYVRAFEDRDAQAVMELDTSFVTERVFGVRWEEDNLILAASKIPDEPIEKRFSLKLDRESWDRGWVAIENEAIVGFIATALHEWNRRLVLWHYYVDRPCRNRGLGRLLLERAIAIGLESGASTM